MFFPILEMIPEDIQNELKQNYNALCELLRHFWSCFPASSKFLEEKVGSSIIHHHHLFIVVRYARVLYYVFLSEIRIFVIIIIVVIIVLSIFIDLSNAY